MQQKTRRYLDWCWVLTMNVMWATQVPVVKMIGDRLGPVAITFVPMITSTLMFLPLLLRGRPRAPWKDLWHFVAAGLFGLFFLQFTYTLGSQRTLAANAGVITLTIPVFVAIVASVLVGEKLNPVRLASFALALLGVLLISLPDLKGSDFRESRYLTGNLIFLAACAGCGFYNAYCKLLVDRGYSELEVLVYTSIVGSLCSLPVFVWFEPFDLAAFLHSGPAALWGIVELSAIVYGASMLLFFHVLKRMDVTQASIGNYLLPFFIALFGVLLLGERITAATLAGGAVVLVSTLLVTVYEGDILRRLRPAASSS